MSETKSKRSGKFVVPGENIGVIEEFTPGAGTYTEDGKIHSKITGRTLLDFLNRKVSIYPLAHPALTPHLGNVVVGEVRNVQSKVAMVRIFKINKSFLQGHFSGVLHVSDSRIGFVESMFEVCRTGEILRAKIVSLKNVVNHLSTAEKNLGVLYAFCSELQGPPELEYHSDLP